MHVSSTQVSRADAAWRTRQSIVRESRRAFAEDDLLAVTVQDIADRVGISRPGLLKHFASKEALLDAVAQEFDDETGQVMGSSPLTVEVAARLSRSVDGYAALSAILLSRAMTGGSDQAASHSHHRRLLTDESKPISDGVRTRVAVWEGLLVISRYLPELNPPGLFARDTASGDGGGSVPALRPRPLAIDTVLTERSGYEPGHRRRARIVADATTVFAENGFGATTMREISERVNVAPSTLRHHFPSKTDLFAEVMRQRDNDMVTRRAGAVLDPTEELLAVGVEAARDAGAESGLIGLYAVLSTEAVSLEHPVHGYFRERFVRTIAYFENLFARAASDQSLNLDARFEATRLIALWDGLQYQSILEIGFDSASDLPRILNAHVAEVLQHQ
ncbi:TetR family transcriptional regulator [Plantibacter sp. PA-3-X8]|nr:TetR family transcriptional regulator [Plantibacter sp. PA-3-X8]TKJ96796.1 hypothetical protein PlfCFBP13513_15360 [Plantibacter flavus]